MVDKALIYLDVPFSSQRELFSFAAADFEKQGYVNKDYLQALLEREEAFPTGMRTAVCGLAIPHVDSQYVLKPGIAFIRVKEPVAFKEMCTNQDVEVKLLFMLLVKDKSKQVSMLSSLMGCFSDAKMLEAFMNAQNKEEVYELLESVTEEKSCKE